MTIELTEHLHQQDRNDLFHWSRDVFPVEGKALQWCEPSHHLVYRETEQAIGHIGLGRYIVLSGGEALDVIGVGQVVVRPEYQGLGIPKDMFETLHQRAPALLGPELFTLFCPPRLQAYYQRHGYRALGCTPVSQKCEALAHSGFCFMYKGSPDPGNHPVLTSHPW